jgi:NRPS condensation-like uncharacterized protein
MLRPLGNFERALRLSNLYAPFNIVVAVELESPPAPAAIQKALATLQKRHPLLRTRIELQEDRPCFVEMHDFSAPFLLLDHQSDWLVVTENELQHRIDSLAGPLFRCTYIQDDSRAKLLLTLQHTIVDATSAAHLLHELLTLASDPLASFPILEPVPAVEAYFPPSHHGLGRFLHSLNYAARQMADELRYQLSSRGAHKPSIKFGARPQVLTMTLDAPLTDSLAHRVRKEKVTLNSLLQAAMMLAVNHCRYTSAQVPLRTFAFPDLRAYVTPSLGAEHMGAYISMLRYTFTVKGDQSVWDLARSVNLTIQESFQRGEKFTASLMSEGVIKMMLALKSMRMGTTALSYTSGLDVLEHYGETKVHALHGFISNIDLGPEFSAQVSLFNDMLIWDMVYLDQEMSHAEAEQIANEIRAILEESVH